MATSATSTLSTPRGVALYVGALLGPSLLLLPGLAAAVAGPASIVAWGGLLTVSGLLARVFTRLGTRIPSGGVAAYVAAGLGPRAGRIVAWCFLAGVVLGAPVVCLIGGGYVAELLGGGSRTAVAVAGALLVLVLAVTRGGARASAGIQLGLVAILVVLVAVATIGSAPSARSAHWTPFAPHGWTAVAHAASVLMLAFVGWEAIAPLTGRLRDPRRQLPRVIGIAFAVTSVLYIGLAAATTGVLGPRAGSSVPLADLLRVAIGAAGPAVAAVAAVALTLAATNAYITGGTVLAAELPTRSGRAGRRSWLPVAIAAAGLLLLGGRALGVLDTTELVALPTALFLAVYLGCTLAAARLFSGVDRIAAGLAGGPVIVMLAFSGWAIVTVAVIAVVVVARERPEPVMGEPNSLAALCGVGPVVVDQSGGPSPLGLAGRCGAGWVG